MPRFLALLACLLFSLPLLAEERGVRVATRKANERAEAYARDFAKATGRALPQATRLRWSAGAAHAYGFRLDSPGLRVERVRFRTPAEAKAFLERTDLGGQGQRTFLRRGRQIVMLSGSELDQGTPAQRRKLLEQAWEGLPAPSGEQQTHSPEPRPSSAGQPATTQARLNGARGLLEHHLNDQELDQGTIKVAGAKNAPAPDLGRDVARFEETLNASVELMNARGQRFDHPIGALSGLWGNTLYKYQKTGKFSDAPFGALFDRLYNGDGRYRDVQECYGQAEIVLEALEALRPQLTPGWELGMFSRPGHYWAGARIELSKLPPAQRPAGAQGRYLYVHMDPWRESFSTETELSKQVSWQGRH